MLKIRTITEVEEFASLKNKWNNLLNKTKSDNIFLTHQWIFTCWRYFGAGKELKIILIEENNEMIGIAPLMLVKKNYFLKTLKFIGDPYSDYQDFILLSGDERRILEVILTYLHKTNFWDVMYLRDIPQSSETLSVHSKISSCAVRKNVESVCPILELPHNWDEFSRMLSQQKRYNLKRYMRRLEKDNQVYFEDVENKKFLEKNVNILFELHQKRWIKENIRGAFYDSRVKEFFQDIVQQFFDQGWLQLRLLKVNEYPVSIYCFFKYNNKFYGYQSGRDPFWSKYSVGDLLLGDTIKYAIQNGIVEFHFLRGNEKYKMHWGTKNTYNYSLELINDVYSSKFKYIIFRRFENLKKIIFRAIKAKSKFYKLKNLLVSRSDSFE